MSIVKALLLLLLAIVLISVANRDNPKHINTHWTNRGKELYFITIEGKTYSLVPDEYEDWFIKEPVGDSFIYIPFVRRPYANPTQ